MNMHPFPIVVAILLALAACRPGPAEFTKSEAPNRLRLDDASVRVDLRFAAGSARLVPGDAVCRRLTETLRQLLQDKTAIHVASVAWH